VDVEQPKVKGDASFIQEPGADGDVHGGPRLGLDEVCCGIAVAGVFGQVPCFLTGGDDVWIGAEQQQQLDHGQVAGLDGPQRRSA